MTLVKIRNRLSDGSYTYDVGFNHIPGLRLHPFSESNADALIEKIADAIRVHSCDFVYIRDEDRNH